MKNTLLFILSGALIASCANDDATHSQENGEIKPQAGLTVNTRANLPTGVVSGVAFPANTENLFAVYAYPTTFEAGNSPYFSNVPVNSDDASALSFDPAQYYPISGDNLLFYAYSPILTEGEGSNQVSGKTTADALLANYVITGQEDILYANALGTNGDGFGKMTEGQLHPAFNFTHKLAQLRFTVKAGDTFTSSVPVTVTSVQIEEPYQAQLNLRDGSMNWNPATTALEVYSDASGIEIGSSTSDEFGVIMVKPQTGENATYVLTIVAGGITYTPVNVTIASGTEAGHAYIVNLTFDATEIAPTATITDWVNNPTNGSGIIG